jgi:NAD(P)-dependent dehydrogenase (short-subunit alcohol dehydrogenase family)
MGEPVYAISQETWDRMMAINVGSFLNLSRSFMPDLLGKGEGRVIAVTAGASLKGGAKMGAYSAAKAGLLRLVESLAVEIAATDIRVNAVMPGTIDTPENRAEMPNADRSKWVPPEAVAEAVVFLASSGAAYVNGAALPVRG